MCKKWKSLLSALLSAAITCTMLPVAFAADVPAFDCGPYLLGAKEDSIVVAWETTTDSPTAPKSTIAYGSSADTLGQAVAVAESNALELTTNGIKHYLHLYHHTLTGLTAGTNYTYQVKLEGGETCTANFTTLDNSETNVRLMTLSDSHGFATRAELDRQVKSNDPMLILHCGDMVEGTGAQIDQFSYWFGSRNTDGSFNNDDFIHYYPVVYTSGNHDQDPANNFKHFVYDIQDEAYSKGDSDEVTGDRSLDYAGMHIITMNSNPWGLFQMNSEATGAQADASTLKEIETAMAWLKKDLASDAAKNAKFRIIMMHHPVSDRFTKRYIPEVIEPGKVDLLLSGHTHSYARAVSSDPTIGAGTVYLTHQDARTYNKKGDFFYINADMQKELLTIENYGATEAGAESKLANTTLISSEKQKLSYSDVSITPNEVLYNGEVTVTATVKNNGNGLAAAVIPVQDNETVRYLYDFDGIITLDPGESKTLTGTLPMTSLGTHTLKMADKTASVTVNYRPATPSFSNLRVKQGQGETNDLNSNILFVKADITNIGNDAGNAEAAFQINGQTVATKTYALNSGETKVAEFTYTFDKAGEYTVTIGNAAPKTIYIEGGISGMPIVKDQSGTGNDAYIHGQPELYEENGTYALKLDGHRDYVEIPDDPSYYPKKSESVLDGEFDTTSNAVSGMVWAKLDADEEGGVSHATEDGTGLYNDGKGLQTDHNPMLVKGIGLGWGTPYMFRLAVRATGKVTYGVCLWDDNGEFSWNDSADGAGIRSGEWAQYTSTFDFVNGGDAYENELHSTHVEKPAFNANIKCWEGTPMYVGLGFKNAILTNRNRGTYHTMLAGSVSQVRFYTTKLTEEEIGSIRSNPTAAGASAKELKIWLNFNPENIETQGTHTTEWTDITAAPTSLAYDAVFSGNAGITATIQTSDDQKTIKEEKEITLENGSHTADLSGMKNAKYARIISTITSDLNATESSVPVLNAYTLTAGNVKNWNTLVDWNAGTFEGAVAHQPGDVYRNHAADFDDYSGTASAPISETTESTTQTTTKPNNDNAFTDITNHWAKASINYVVEQGLFDGTTSKTFSPNASMTRGMFVSVLGRMSKVNPTADSNFTDVPKDMYYAPYIAWAAEKELVNGIDETHFAPNVNITREQMVTLLARYLETQTDIQLTDKATAVNFSDRAQISAYAMESIAKMQTAGLITGRENNQFVPKGNATRAEVAALLTRYLKA